MTAMRYYGKNLMDLFGKIKNFTLNDGNTVLQQGKNALRRRISVKLRLVNNLILEKQERLLELNLEPNMGVL